MAWLINLYNKLFGNKKQKGGLDKAFRVGEHIPLKGIWFQVEEVDFDELVLRPKTATAKRIKVIKDLKVKYA